MNEEISENVACVKIIEIMKTLVLFACVVCVAWWRGMDLLRLLSGGIR